MNRLAFACYLLGLPFVATIQAAEPSPRVSTFQVDATPRLGSPLANGTVKPAAEIVTPLTARGIVLLGTGQPFLRRTRSGHRIPIRGNRSDALYFASGSVPANC